MSEKVNLYHEAGRAMTDDCLIGAVVLWWLGFPRSERTRDLIHQCALAVCRTYNVQHWTDALTDAAWERTIREQRKVMRE